VGHDALRDRVSLDVERRLADRDLMDTSDLVLRFLGSIGRPAEAEFYLRAFRAERRHSFAIIAVSDSAMRLEPDALAVDLRFLARLGLTPVLVFGHVIPEPARAHAETIASHLAGDVPCAIATADRAGAIISAGAIPLVPLDRLPGIAPGDIDGRFAALTDLATRLESRKLIFLGRRSGLQPDDGHLLSLVDLSTEGEALSRPGALPPKQAALLAQVARLLARVPHRMTVAVTSPLELLRELFTERGAGTLIRRGSTIATHRDLAELDRARLRALLVAAFDRQPSSALFERPFDRILVADDYLGAALVASTPLGPYLSKFAVDPRARGEGVGRDLWRALTRQVPSFFWRSRSENPFTSWYLRHCDGMSKAEGWHVFWRGLPDARILGAIAYARSAPSDFEDD
jgi:GNAT superfamily N-acetyltransferase